MRRRSWRCATVTVAATATGISTVGKLWWGIAVAMHSRPARCGTGFFIFHHARKEYNSGMSELDPQLDKFLRQQPKLGQGVYLARTAVVFGAVTIGAHSSVWYHTVLRGDINRIVVTPRSSQSNLRLSEPDCWKRSHTHLLYFALSE